MTLKKRKLAALVASLALLAAAGPVGTIDVAAACQQGNNSCGG